MTRRNASTTVGSNWLPECVTISCTASAGRAGLSIRPVGGHGVVGVDDGEDARFERDAVSLQPERVALAVEALVMVEEYRQRALQEADLRDEDARQQRVPLHGLPFATAQGARLAQDGVGHAYLADIVEERAALDVDEPFFRHVHLPGDGDGQVRDAFRMAFRRRVFGVEGGAERLEGRIVGRLELTGVCAHFREEVGLLHRHRRLGRQLFEHPYVGAAEPFAWRPVGARR